MSREKALEQLRSIQNLGHYPYFVEDKSDKQIWVCVIYNNPLIEDEKKRLEIEKKLVQRILRGEIIRGINNKDIEVFLGYGKLLGIHREKLSKDKELIQYLLYDIVTIVGKRLANTRYEVFHESWVGFGNWVKSMGLHIPKEVVTFSKVVFR